MIWALERYIYIPTTRKQKFEICCVLKLLNTTTTTLSFEKGVEDCQGRVHPGLPRLQEWPHAGNYDRQEGVGGHEGTVEYTGNVCIPPSPPEPTPRNKIMMSSSICSSATFSSRALNFSRCAARGYLERIRPGRIICSFLKFWRVFCTAFFPYPGCGLSLSHRAPEYPWPIGASHHDI